MTDLKNKIILNDKNKDKIFLKFISLRGSVFIQATLAKFYLHIAYIKKINLACFKKIIKDLIIIKQPMASFAIRFPFILTVGF